MFQFAIASCLVAAAAGRFVDPASAKILKEQRFNTGDGRFGSAYAQEDGVVFREETGAQGERIGQYSYIGDDGRQITVKYSAGKDGFKILEGAHVPTGATGQNSAPYDPQQAAPVYQNSQSSQQQYHQPAPAPVRQPAAAPVDPNFNPFINPHDATHRDFRYNSNAATFSPASQLNSNAVPNCANCAGVNPFINPFDQSHQAGGHLAGHLAGHQAGYQTQYQPAQNTYQQPTTPPPKRYFPPGQLKLNRFETGFNFDFASQ